MKYLLIFFIFYFSTNLQSQNDVYYEIVYNTKSMIHNNYKKPILANASLYFYKDKSIYQFVNQKKLDSISLIREIDNEDISRYYSKEHYVIEYEKNRLHFYDVIGDNEYQYKEELFFKWNLLTELKTIQGYKCKKAKVVYGGRNWIAWYTLDLPLNSGPYKFKGLPGLIVKITDETNSYDFELYSIKKHSYLPLKKTYHIKKENERIIVNRTKYNEIRYKYNSLSFQEKMNLLNKTQGVVNEMVFTGADGSNPFENQRNVNRSKNNNFIEIDHKM